MYDTAQPRVSVTSPDREFLGDRTTFEVGQGNVWGEITFWLSMGYTCEVARWNGQVYKTDQTFTKADL